MMFEVDDRGEEVGVVVKEEKKEVRLQDRSIGLMLMD